jgi:repressor LexA
MIENTNTANAPMNSPLPPLTEKEKAVLQMIELSLSERGLSPSFQEIKDHFGFASFNSIQNYLKQLVSKGYIQTSSHQKRAIQVLHSANSVQKIMQLQKQTQMQTHTLAAPEAFHIPLLGKVAAGQPLESFTHDEYVDVPASMVRNPSKSFALKVSGSSMIEDGIFDGDILIVQKQVSASNGEIVVASIDNESTVKRMYLKSSKEAPKEGHIIELRPANSTMKSMWYPPDQVKIQGVVVGLVRKF